jgi:hypothetical protein
LTPTRTLQRALDRERGRLATARQRAVDRLGEAELRIRGLRAEVRAIDARVTALDAVSVARDEASAGKAVALEGEERLRGADLRRRAVQLLAHYREWFAWFVEAGCAAEGRDPLATFLTNVARSPVVRRGSRPGTYRLDGHARERLAGVLAESQAQLADLLKQPERQKELAQERRRLSGEARRAERELAEVEDGLTHRRQVRRLRSVS